MALSALKKTYFYTTEPGLKLKIRGKLHLMNLSRFLFRIFLSISILLVYDSQLKVQGIRENNFPRYTKQDGLSHNAITGLLQDSTYYIFLYCGRQWLTKEKRLPGPFCVLMSSLINLVYESNSY